MTTFTAGEGQFRLNGEPHRLLSGALHYFRIVPEYWEDRLLKLKACGFTTVETYLAWNVHEPDEGEFNFEGIADVEKFIQLAGELGLHVIVRPSPYICAEWEFGGLPGWLLSSEMALRCSDPRYLAKVDAYYDELIPRLVPLLCSNGGPIIAVQVENEYGSYGNDTAYLEYIRQGLISRGVDVLLFTSDGPTDEMLLGGTVPGVLATANFGSRVEESFAKFREHRQDDPLMCMEYWNGWFDHWMEEHHVREASDVAKVLDDLFNAGSSVNFYMFHGGTNFGFYNGANHLKRYEPTVTSYDYDAPLTEWGDITPKYEAVREVMVKHFGDIAAELPAPIAKTAYGEVRMTERADLLDGLEAIAAGQSSVCPVPMEKLGQSYGFILYATFVKGPRSGQKLYLQDVHDRALVFLDGQYIGTVERWDPQPLDVSIPAEGAKLEILVENMGRINYGPFLKDHKGITEGVRLDNQFLFNWHIHCLPMKDKNGVVFKEFDAAAKVQPNRPAFYRGSFQVEGKPTGDTFLRCDRWEKGVVWVNGFNLGRYWKAGPQKTLYVPAPLLREGNNEIVVFELHGTSEPVVVLDDKPDLGSKAAVDQGVLSFTGDE